MKKILLCLCVVICFATCAVAKGAHSASAHHNCGSCRSHHSSGSSSEHVYLTNTEHNTYEQRFPNCKEHYAITETTTNYYSNGTKNVFSNSTIYNSDGSVLVTDCLSVAHLVYLDKHYFIINKKGKGYQIVDSQAKVLTTRKYSRMSEIENGKILVKYDKKYGIIDINENVIVPIKYQQMEVLAKDIYLTKLNGYYGVLDSDNNILIANDCDRIKRVNDVLIIRRYDKYGLANLEGSIIYNVNYDKIKKMGEYILIKQNKKYGVYNPETKEQSKIMYKKVKLDRNHLKGLVGEGTTVEVEFGNSL